MVRFRPGFGGDGRISEKSARLAPFGWVPACVGSSTIKTNLQIPMRLSPASLCLQIPAVSAVIGLLLAPAALAAIPQGNLIVNGSGASPTTTGWTVIANGGSGWGHSASGGYDATPGFFITSYVQCRRSQTIDLLAAGATEAELDSAPIIKVSEAISCYLQGAADKYYIKVELRDASNAVIATWNSGTQAAPLTAPTSWTVISGEFKNYGPGVRYIYFEDGGIDGGYWDGPWGTYHDAATVEFVPDGDGDGMPDQWELANGTNPAVNDAAADLDLDTLTNMQEMTLGTRADLKDTDADGYDDPYEDKIGTWLDAQHTGTNPLNPDTDGDGILDGKENPDLPFVDASQPGTDPNKSDTDQDGMPDLAEIVNGSDPRDPGSAPTFTYGGVMMEDFDGNSLNSTYAFTQSAGAFAPAVTASGVSPQGNAARLTLTGTGSSNTSIAWDAIPANAKSVRLIFDFRLSADVSGENADGFGIGLFKTGRVWHDGGPESGIQHHSGNQLGEPGRRDRASERGDVRLRHLWRNRGGQHRQADRSRGGNAAAGVRGASLPTQRGGVPPRDDHRHHQWRGLHRVLAATDQRRERRGHRAHPRQQHRGPRLRHHHGHLPPDRRWPHGRIHGDHRNSTISSCNRPRSCRPCRSFSRPPWTGPPIRRPW